MRQMIEKAERKRSWFVAFREWVEGVANFLDEKVSRLASRYTIKYIINMGSVVVSPARTA